MGKTYPSSVDDLENHMSNIANRLFGNRFKSDQTLYEYLIEFLLVFVSAKEPGLINGKMKFHDTSNGRLDYWCEPRMGLRRFIYYDKARKNGVVSIDERAYQEMIQTLKQNIVADTDMEKQNIIDGMQDLLHGYAVVIRKRNWCVQMLLPVCPEMILCDAMPEEKTRRGYRWDNDREKVDNSFSFDKRNFIARGGEIYYLHILQALEGKENIKIKLEDLLQKLLGSENNKLSRICNMIQETWEETMGLDKKDVSQHLNMSFIPEEAYRDCGAYSIDELVNFLSSGLPSINKLEILAKGVMFQIMRMMSWRVDNYLGIEKKAWIVDMSRGFINTVKKIAADSFINIENGFLTALNKSAREIGDDKIPKEKYMSVLNKARRSSLDIFRSKGKELQCIIPTNGQYERFSLSEDVIRFLVLSLIPPQKKMTLNMFLDKLYIHYRIVIGPAEYRRSIEGGSKLEPALANSFTDNLGAFQAFLKSTGFLRELSDATSIVINPYSDVLGDQR